MTKSSKIVLDFFFFFFLFGEDGRKILHAYSSDSLRRGGYKNNVKIANEYGNIRRINNSHTWKRSLSFHVCELFIRRTLSLRTLVVRMKCRTEKSVSMIRIFKRFLCFFTCGKQNYTCIKQNEVSKFVNVVCDLRNMAMCRRNLQLNLLKAMVEENDVLNELYGVIKMRKIQLSKRKHWF